MIIIIYLAGLLFQLIVLCSYHKVTIFELIQEEPKDVLVAMLIWPIVILAEIAVVLGENLRK